MNAPSSMRRPDRCCRRRSPRRSLRARLPSLAARLRQRDAPAFVGEATAELDPARLGPELVVARRAVDEHHRARPRRAPATRARASPNDGGESMRVPSARRDQLARAVERVAVRLDPDRLRRPASAPAPRGSRRRCGWRGRSSRRAPGARSAPTWSGPAGRRSRRSARAAGAARRRASRARVRARPPAALRPAAQRAVDDLGDAVDALRPAARTPARRPSRSARPGSAARMSATTGSAWTTSPSDDSLTIRTRKAPAARSARCARAPPQCAAASTCASGLTARSAAMQSASMRSSASASFPRSAAPAPASCSTRGSRPKPSSYSTRTPSIVTISLRAGELRLGAQARDDLGRLAFGARHVQLGRREARRQRVQHRARVGARADDLEQPRRGVGGVVEAVPALAEEDVAAHLAGERRAGLAHLGLDQRVAGLPHQRHAAGGADQRRQSAAST